LEGNQAMPDPRFYISLEPLSAADAAAIAGAVLKGAGAKKIRHAASLDDEDLAEALAHAEAEKHAAKVSGRAVGLLLAPANLSDGVRVDGAIGLVKSPKLGFARVAEKLHRVRDFSLTSGIHPSAEIGVGVKIHPTAVIAENVVIGANSSVGPHVAIGPGVVIGGDCEIGAGASLTCAVIGARALIFPGARIGQAGFGFAEGPGGFVRVPQLGRVLIGDDVEVGANTTIDRGALGDTVIGDGVKIDNLVQIGHNVRVGRHSAFAAQVGIAGSTILGEKVMIGGQGGLADHLRIGDGAQIIAQSGVMSHIPAGEIWGGAPARPKKAWLREAAALARLAKKKKTDHED
jgi:UDP-3-O-[3-hydroxymyristoyl] glucosamine N-acyltransferase